MLNMNEVRRIVVKVGSSTLTYDNGKPNIRRIERLVRTISDLQNRGFEMVLVSSGAVAVGTAKLGPGGETEGAVGQAGGGGCRAVRADAHLRQNVSGIRHQRGANPADAREYRR